MNIDQQALDSVKNFRAMLPTLNGFVQALTGDPKTRIVVSTTSNGHTLGTDIHFRPPLALGARRAHEYSLCDKRDEAMKLLCEACDIHERIYRVIYHEMGHIVNKSLTIPESNVWDRYLTLAHSEGLPNVAKGIGERIGAMQFRPAPRDYAPVFRTINSFLSFTWNAVEDARIDNILFQARQGMRLIFEAQLSQESVNGFEVKEGSTVRQVFWREYPLQPQVQLALYFHLMGYDYSTWLGEEAVEVMAHPSLQPIHEAFKEAKDTHDAGILAFRYILALQKLGLFKDKRDPEPEPEPQPDQPEEATDEPSEPESGEEGQEGGSEADPSDQEDPEGQEGAEAGEQGDRGSEESDSGSGVPGVDSEPPTSDSPGDSRVDEDEPSSDEADDSPESEGMGEEGVPEEVDGSDGEADSDDQADSPDDGEPMASGEPGDEGEADGDGGDSPEEGVDSSSGESSEAGDSGVSGGEPGGPNLDGSGEDGQSGSGSSVETEQEDDALESADEVSNESSSESSTPDDGPTTDTDTPGEDPDGATTGHTDEAGTTMPDDTAAPIGDESDDSIDPHEWEAHKDYSTPLGDESDVERMLDEVNPHEKFDDLDELADTGADAFKMEVAIEQGDYFETGSRVISGVREHRKGDSTFMRGGRSAHKFTNNAGPHIADMLVPPPATISQTLAHLRIVMAENKRAKHERNLESGKINPKVLGRRASTGDVRLFKRKTRPGKRSYHVLLVLDFSASTNWNNNMLLQKQAVMAQAEVLDRLGISFAIIGHTCYSGHKQYLEVMHIKEANEVWNDETRARLRDMPVGSANLDGHALEYARKAVLKVPNITSRIIMYYSDGKMPAENHDEELVILTREIKYCKRDRVALVGVGIHTDSPTEHGLETVEINAVEDVPKVVAFMEDKLIH